MIVASTRIRCGVSGLDSPVNTNTLLWFTFANYQLVGTSKPSQRCDFGAFFCSYIEHNGQAIQKLVRKPIGSKKIHHGAVSKICGFGVRIDWFRVDRRPIREKKKKVWDFKSIRMLVDGAFTLRAVFSPGRTLRYEGRETIVSTATVCFSIEHACPRDAYLKTSNGNTSFGFAGNFRDLNIQRQDGDKNVNKTIGLQSNQVKRTPQESINEFIIQKLNPLLVVDFRLTPVTGTTNGFIFQIINSLIESWGVRLTWFDCKHHEVFSYLQCQQRLVILVFSKSSYYETWQNTKFTTAILFCFIFTA